MSPKKLTTREFLVRRQSVLPPRCKWQFHNFCPWWPEVCGSWLPERQNVQWASWPKYMSWSFQYLFSNAACFQDLSTYVHQGPSKWYQSVSLMHVQRNVSEPFKGQLKSYSVRCSSALVHCCSQAFHSSYVYLYWSTIPQKYFPFQNFLRVDNRFKCNTSTFRALSMAPAIRVLILVKAS